MRTPTVARQSHDGLAGIGLVCTVANPTGRGELKRFSVPALLAGLPLRPAWGTGRWWSERR